MNNQDYKLKYLKYKNKYLNLKGGVHFNNDLNRCINDEYDKGEYKDYPIYDAILNRCCNNDQYTNCKKLVHTIDHPENGVQKTQYNFDNDETTNYKGFEIGLYNNIHVYKYFTKINNNRTIDLQFNLKTVLGKGANGVVLQYECVSPDKTYVIAVKYGKIENEISVINHIIEKNKLCSELVIKHIVYTSTTGIPCIIMENAVGTIKDLIPAIQNNIKILIDILYAIVIAIKCLHDIGLYYVDIKMENILYRNTDHGIQIILADIGGAVKLNDIPGPTYPPYEYDVDETYKYHNAVNKQYSYDPYKIITINNIPYPNREFEKERIITWGIGILTLMLLNVPEIYMRLRLDNRVVDTMARIKQNEEIKSDNKFIIQNVEGIIKIMENDIKKLNAPYILHKIIEKTLCKNHYNLSIILNKLNDLRLANHRDLDGVDTQQKEIYLLKIIINSLTRDIRVFDEKREKEIQYFTSLLQQMHKQQAPDMMQDEPEKMQDD